MPTAVTVLRINNGFLTPLKAALTRQLVYAERQREGYVKLLASIPAGNATLQAYVDAYETEVNGLKEMLHQIERSE